MFGKMKLYYWTIRSLKPEQIFWRVGTKLGMKCALKGAHPTACGNGITPAVPELDYDSVFLSRFNADELLHDRVTFLHESAEIDWEGSWHCDRCSHLWNFNLHYFEYLHPMAARFKESGDRQYLDKTLHMIRGWIRQNPVERGGDGWSSYTISMRLPNWMAYLASTGEALEPHFREEMEQSMIGQYVYLSDHLEKHILGNHYYENLKALVLCALYFGDAQSLPIYLSAFRKECHEQILADGMHFELSPMYHKIVLEGLLRVTSALRQARMPDRELEQQAQKMLDAAYSICEASGHTPLFNDSGDNVAKSLFALRNAASCHLDMAASYRESFPESGYYIFRNSNWKLIVDAGQPGPDYIPGHSHCDAMSFELYRNDQPILVNCGTYAYQHETRNWFRSTAAHNTVQVAGTEQSEIWSTFRLARRSGTRVLEVFEDGISMEMTDYQGHRVRRDIHLMPDALCIKDSTEGLQLQSYLHSIDPVEIISKESWTARCAMYAPEFGLMKSVHEYTATARDSIELTVVLA